MLKNLKRTHDLFGDTSINENIAARKLKITSKILDEYKDLGELPDHVERKFKKQPVSNALVVKEKPEKQEQLFGNSQQLIKIKESRKMPKPDWHPPWKLMRVISGHTGWVRCIDIDSSNEWFATGASDRMIKIWDMASGTLKLSLTGHISTVRGVAISDRHPYLFSCGEDKQIKCWDLEYNKVIRHYHGHLSGIYSLALHPTLDVLVTGGRDSTARVWDMRTKNQIFALTGHINTINAIQTNGVDPQIITASADSTIKLWDLSAGKAMTTLTHHKKGDNGSMYFWDWKTGYNFQTNQAIAQPGSLENEAGIFASTFDKSGARLLTCEADKTIKVWKEDDNATMESHPIVNWKPKLAKAYGL
ncbi:pre-mRNA-splicing factor prp46 [Terramyces sp. JEL0728]|nr:pre-mRNA-splicing factor prp46 [Terramyces sp. JEL0728]